MERIYRLNKKKVVIYLLIFILISSVATYLSIKDNIEKKKVLDKYDESVKVGDIRDITGDILKVYTYNRDSEKYSLGLLRTYGIVGIELIILYIFFIKTGKLVMDKEGIKVYGLCRKKTKNIYPWESIDNIKFQYGEGIRGFIPEYGMKISKLKDDGKYEKGFIPIGRLKNHNEIQEVILASHPQIEIETVEKMRRESPSIANLLNTAYIEYKSNFQSYIVYMVIISIFAVLNTAFKNSPVAFIISIANLYFGYRARIAMNYRAYMSYKGEEVDFDSTWNYAKGKIGRYFGANIVLSIIPIILIWIGYLCIISNIAKSHKIFIITLLAIGCFFAIYRLYLITYIASILDEKKSYMAANSLLIKKYYKEVLLVVSFLALTVSPLIFIVAKYYKDLYMLQSLITKVTYIDSILQFFVTPYITCFIMSFLKDLPAADGGVNNE